MVAGVEGIHPASRQKIQSQPGPEGVGRQCCGASLGTVSNACSPSARRTAGGQDGMAAVPETQVSRFQQAAPAFLPPARLPACASCQPGHCCLSPPLPPLWYLLVSQKATTRTQAVGQEPPIRGTPERLLTLLGLPEQRREKAGQRTGTDQTQTWGPYWSASIIRSKANEALRTCCHLRTFSWRRCHELNLGPCAVTCSTAGQWPFAFLCV